MNKDTGFYKCDKCKIMIEVETMSVTKGNKIKRATIHKCPSCYGKIKTINEKKFNETKAKIFIHVKRRFYKRVIDLGVKYL